MKVIKTIWDNPKAVVEPYSDPQTSPLGPKKFINNPKLSQNQMSEMKETKKMKVVQLHK